MSFSLTGFPLFVLVISILISGGGIAGPGTTIGFSGQNQTATANLQLYDCSHFTPPIFGIGGSACFTALPLNAIITCTSPSQGACEILSYCPSGLQSPLICVFGYTNLNKGESITLSNGEALSTSNTQLFNLSDVGSGGFIAWIGILVAVAGIVGLQALGSGESSESVHMLFMGAIFMGAWIFLSALEGFPSDSTNSFFVQLNGALANLGTTVYVTLTLVFMLGFVKAVSRGQ